MEDGCTSARRGKENEMWTTDKTTMVTPDQALPGRTEPVLTMPCWHRVFGDPLDREFPGCEVAYFAMGCFWGAERIFWQLDGVRSTAVGYMGGFTPNPSYEEVCTARTGHAEAVRVVFDPAQISYAELVRVFFENHDPTQGMRQGNDVGTQYRSAIYTTSEEQDRVARAAVVELQPRFSEKGFGTITTEVAPAGDWYWAEDYHQQYLDRVRNGYCNHGPNGVSCQVGVLDD